MKTPSAESWYARQQVVLPADCAVKYATGCLGAWEVVSFSMNGSANASPQLLPFTVSDSPGFKATLTAAFFPTAQSTEIVRSAAPATGAKATTPTIAIAATKDPDTDLFMTCPPRIAKRDHANKCSAEVRPDPPSITVIIRLLRHSRPSQSPGQGTQSPHSGRGDR
jgi:hypothetical protein